MPANGGMKCPKDGISFFLYSGRSKHRLVQKMYSWEVKGLRPRSFKKMAVVTVALVAGLQSSSQHSSEMILIFFTNK